MKQRLLENGLRAGFVKWVTQWNGLAVVVVVFFFAFGLLLLTLRQRHIDNQELLVSQDAQTSVGDMQLRLRGDIDYLLLLAKERADEKLTPESFLRIGSQYVADHPELINITWVDKNLIIQNVAPLQGNRQIIGLSVSLPGPARASQTARQTRQPVYTDVFEAIQGGYSFEVWVPVFRDNQFMGLFAGVYSLGKLLRYALPLEVQKNNYFEILDENRNVLAEFGVHQNAFPEMSKVAPISPFGNAVTLRVTRFGNEFWSQNLIVLMLVCSGLAMGLVYFMFARLKELEARKKIGSDLKESEELLSAVINNTSAVIYIKDLQGRYILINHQYEKLFTLKQEEVKGKTDMDIFPREIAEKFIENDKKVLASGQVQEIEEVAPHEDGLHTYISIKFPVFKESGGIFGLGGISTDINERIKAREELSRHKDHLEELVREQTKGLVIAKEEAEKSNAAKTEFLSRMSHELRTPLNSIMGFGQLLIFGDEGNLKEQQKEFISRIMVSGKHLLALINEVLDLSKIERGEFAINKEHINASLLIQDAVFSIESIAKERRIEILNHSLGDLSVVADPTAFRQIILNLLSNAIKYNVEGGSVKIEKGLSGNDRVWVSISDTGSGIPEDKMGTLFEPFNRMGHEFGEIEGTGIGLSITKKLVEKMDGSISAECVVGQGCCFKITLPLGEKKIVNDEESQLLTSLPENLKEGFQLLYIEDDIGNQKMIQRILERQMPQVKLLMAKAPLEGIELAKKYQPDLILMDIHLPQMDGIAAYKKLQSYEETRNIPVVALSALVMKDQVKLALEAGFQDYITKPIDVPILLSKIGQYFK